MKHFSLFLLALASYSLASFTSAAPSDFSCTMEYAPVCAKVPVQCIRAPCYPVYQTFSNMCVMTQTSSAIFAYKGECKTSEAGSPAVLSERLQNSLKRQYDAFIVRISGLDSSARLTKLELINTRIVTRLTALSINPIPLTLSQEMMADKMKYALLFIQNLVQADISYLTDEMAGMRYISKDSSMCGNIKFYCSTTEVPFFTEKGCGCKK